MKEERMFDILSLLDETLIEEAEDKRAMPEAKINMIKWLAAVACIVLFLGGTWYLSDYNGVRSIIDKNSGGGNGHPEGSTFMHYAGPVMPLNIMGDIDGIKASRQINYDFTGSDIKVAAIKDHYALTNTSSEDRTFTTVYPFASSINDSNKYTPEITLGGQPIQTELLFGDYCGDFEGVQGPDGMDDTTLNLKALPSWEGYQALLKDGSYFRSAQSETSLKDQTVTIYSINDENYPEKYHAATLALSFTLPEASRVITNGMNGMNYDEETNEYQFSYFLPHSNAPRVIILGEPPISYTLKGYENGACEQEIPEITGTVHTETKLLSEVIRECMGEYAVSDGYEINFSPLVTEQHLYRAVISMLNYTELGDSPKDRYQWMSLNDLISEAYAMNRMMYLVKEITIPAGQTVELASSFIKGASYDFYCVGSEDNRGVDGYDMMTTLGSDLSFTEQRASISLPATIQLLRQNFGFDINRGITDVVLDTKKERYYLEVKTKDETQE